MSTCNGMVFELNGARALSDFRAARVLAALQRVSSNIEAVSGRFVHFVHASRELTKAEEERLASLLTYGDAAEDVRADLAFMVVPRLGTISPWASKATDIVKNCGIEGVLRVERGTVYSLALKAPLTEEEAAQAAGRFDDEIVPVPVKVKKEIVEFKKDEFPRAGSTVEGLAKLRGAFPVGPEGVEDEIVHTFEPTGIHEADTKKHVQRVTAGNASGINDGAAAIVLASGEAVKKYNLKPMAKLVSWGQGGVDPKIMGVGPVPASRQAMQKAGLTIDDIDLVEANEAFAAQSIAVARELGFDMSKVNVNGGAISIGHPVGASGARIIVTLLHEMLKRDDAKKGLATLCIGGGQGVATIFEKC